MFFWSPDEVAERVADGRRLEQAARELVEQRLEGVVVVAVDEHDLGVGVLELLRGADAGEAAAEDQDGPRGLSGVSLLTSSPSSIAIPQTPVAVLAGLEHDDALAGPERVRRAGHRLDGEAATVTLGSGSPVKSSRYG